MGKKYLSNVIDFDRDIAPYRIIRIYSGVGSGKNTWANELAQKYSVLLITSRKNTADSQSEKSGALRCTGSIDLEYLEKKTQASKRRYIICTNSTIEHFAKNQYNAENEYTHIWKYFDFIILDEAHSLIADTSYSNAPFHVKRFLRCVQDQDKHCKLIFMTGTPEPIDYLFSEETRNSTIYKSLDFFNTCRSVQPETVTLYPRSYIVDSLVDYLQDGGKIIYFASRIRNIKKLVDELEGKGISEDQIGISYSKKDRDNLFSKSLVSKKERIDDSLTNDEKLPDDIKIFLTTAKNKEGISIKNEDINAVVVESTQLDELIQMAGRVRNGLDELVIIYDVDQPESWENEFDYQIDRECRVNVGNISDAYLSDCESTKERLSIISRIEDRFPYLRYDYFSSQFYLYSEKMHQHRNAAKGRKFILSVIKDWNKTYYCETSGETLCGGLEFERWFPYSNICVRIAKEIDCRPETVKERLRCYIEGSPYWGRIISLEERDQLIAELKEQIAKFPKKACWELKISQNFSSINPLLKKLGLELSDEGGKNNRALKQLKIIPLVEKNIVTKHRPYKKK